MARKKRIGIIMGRIYKSSNKKLLSGILEQARALDYSTVIFTLNEECANEKVRSGEKNLFQALRFSQLDGIVYAPYSFDSDDFLEYIDSYLLANCDKPVVRIGIESDRFLPVWYDDKGEIAEMTLHLIYGHGCRRLLCLTGPEDAEVAQNRAAGFTEAMTSAGLPVSGDDVIYGDFWIHSSRVLAEEIASGAREMPDAVVCASDTMAIALCDALDAHHITVPEDLLVTGYDGSVETIMHAPAITTYQPSQEMLGRNAMCRLYETMTGKPAVPVKAEKGALLCRESCGCKAQHLAYSLLDFDQIIAQEGILDCTVSASFYEADSLNELVDSMFAMRYKFMDVSRMGTERLFLCLCDDWDSVVQTDGGRAYRAEGYSDTMYLIGSEGSRLSFPLEEMLPVSMDTDALTSAFFMPVHFQDQCFGYIVLEVQDSTDDFNMEYIRYCREVNNALKFLCTQNELKRLLYRQKLSQSRDELTGLYVFEQCRDMWADMLDNAGSYQEQVYLIAVTARGLRHIENAVGSVESDRCLASFADLLAKCCNGREKIFKAGERSFVILGSSHEAEMRVAAYLKQIGETVWQKGYSREESHMVYAKTATQVFAEPGSLTADGLAEAITRMIRELTESASDRLSDHVQYAALLTLRRELYLHPETDWNGELCSKRLNLSKSYFHKLYMKVFGVSFMQDLQNSRLSSARRLLETTSLLLPDIAEQCGYDYYNFMRVFKKETGMTPTQYRKARQ